MLQVRSRAKKTEAAATARENSSIHPDSSLGNGLFIVGLLITTASVTGPLAAAVGAGYITAVGLGLALSGVLEDAGVADEIGKALSSEINYLISPSSQAQQDVSQTQDSTPSQLGAATSGSYGQFNTAGGDLLKSNNESAQQVAAKLTPSSRTR